MQFCRVLSKLSLRSCEKKLSTTKSDSFSLFKRKASRRDLVINNFFSSTTKNACLWLCVKTVIDHKKSSARKSHQKRKRKRKSRQHLVSCVCSLTFMTQKLHKLLITSSLQLFISHTLSNIPNFTDSMKANFLCCKTL